jgi:hypothetical protein
MFAKKMAKKGQVTLFIIIAIVIVAIALLLWIFWPRIAPGAVPREIAPVESALQQCVSEQVKDAAKTAALQGGYLEMPAFEPGSAFMPFSNQLDFLGMNVPYWFYVSGNNLVKIQKPEISEIQQQMAAEINEKVKTCAFDSLVAQGYIINFSGEPKSTVTIKQSSIETTLDWPMTVEFEGKKTALSQHNINTKSSFGALYDTASKIFDSEQQQLFLENYSLDVLNLYAPVDGLEISCAPKVWNPSEVKQQIVEALEGNIGAIKVKGDYYEVSADHKYFEVDTGTSVKENVYFLFHREMPLKFDVWPTENGLMKADPIGSQPGLEMLQMIGFCYVPYHFVYSVSFPVLVQLNSGDELFQFPMLVVIDRSQAREAQAAEEAEVSFDICQFKNQEITVHSYDQDSKPIAAEVYYKCFNQACPLGKTEIAGGTASLRAMVPQCYNGFLVVRAENYSDAVLMVSSIESFTANIFLKPRHILNLDLGIAGDEQAIITFSSSNYSTSVYWPDQKQIELAEGIYDVRAQLFKNATISLPNQTGEKCVKVPSGGLAGILGQQTEKCFSIDVPSEELTSVIFGGGSATFDVFESELADASKIKITIPEFDVPADLNDLSGVYGMLETSKIEIALEK